MTYARWLTNSAALSKMCLCSVPLDADWVQVHVYGWYSGVGWIGRTVWLFEQLKYGFLKLVFTRTSEFESYTVCAFMSVTQILHWICILCCKTCTYDVYILSSRTYLLSIKLNPFLWNLLCSALVVLSCYFYLSSSSTTDLLVWFISGKINVL